MRFIHVVNFALASLEPPQPRQGTGRAAPVTLEVGAQRRIPGAAELGRIGTVAQLVGAGAGHADGTAGFNDRPGRGEHFDEADLARGGPAVVAGLERDRGEADARRLHP